MAKISPNPAPTELSKIVSEPLSGKGTDGHQKSPQQHHHTEQRGSIVHSAVIEWRYFMHWSGWYDSSLAVAIRRFIRGKFFACLAMACLFIALFCADLFIICGSSQNLVLDIVLIFVMLIFGFEFLGLAATDASYLFSFFFWMDMLGTLSMIFDISYMLGPNATEPEKYTGAGAEENLIVVRAARATKLGARAGRLSRVMKLLRFLPFGGGGAQESDVKMARVISSQLTNVLSTRVAFLTICIVVVLPIFGMFTYPEVDDSMITWAEILAGTSKELEDVAAKSNVCIKGQTANSSSILETSLAQKRLDIELNEFAKFYSELSYGPFKACYGYTESEASSADFMNCLNKACVPVRFNATSFTEPGRKNFIRIISHKGFMTAFDLSTPKQMESVANAGLIVFIILVMCIFGMVTSNSITVIALHPLERMLSVVRTRCKQIFKYTDILEDSDSDADDEEEYDDTDHTSEFALLEKVVAKLAAIAQLSNTEDEEDIVAENMTEDDIMRMNWMQGNQVKSRKRASKTGEGATGDESQAEPPAERLQTSNSILDNIDADVIEALDSPTFCTIDLHKEEMHPIAAHIILTNDGSTVWVRQNVQEQHVFKFVTECSSRYQDNPFHNYAHALDVQYAAARHMRLIEAHRFLPDTSQFWLLVAAIGHDLGHLGVNNQYLIETSHELALKYNDRSPLENMHCATLFQVTSDPQCNVFAQVEKDLYKEMRKGIINAILHTDVTKHNEMMKELVMLYQMNSEAFDSAADGPSPAVVEVLQSHMQLTLNAMLHCADVGNPMKPWDIAHRLAMLCVDEFFAQGDLEKAAGIPVQMLNDRDKVNRPNSQLGFIEFVIAPMAEGIVHIFPTLDGLAENLGVNIKRWCEKWAETTNPSPEVVTKTEARVNKVSARCQALMRVEDVGPAGGGMKLSIRHDS